MQVSRVSFDTSYQIVLAQIYKDIDANDEATVNNNYITIPSRHSNPSHTHHTIWHDIHTMWNYTKVSGDIVKEK